MSSVFKTYLGEARVENDSINLYKKDGNLDHREPGTITTMLFGILPVLWFGLTVYYLYQTKLLSALFALLMLGLFLLAFRVRKVLSGSGKIPLERVIRARFMRAKSSKQNNTLVLAFRGEDNGLRRRLIPLPKGEDGKVAIADAKAFFIEREIEIVELN